MKKSAKTRVTAHLLASCARLFLLTIARPTTRLIGEYGGQLCHESTGKTPLKHRLLSPLARFVNWGTQGAITLSHPKMAYDPIAWRRKRLNSQWASQITGIQEAELDAQARAYIRQHQSQPPSPSEPECVTFSIFIGFHTHLHFFQDCIDSVAEAAKKTPEVFLELLIVNDDPRISSDSLKSIISTTELQALIRSNQVNLGICRSINETLPHAKGQWILHLDCDDLLHPDALITLYNTIRCHPDVRFISSRSLDLDEQGRIFAYRLRNKSPEDLIENNYASHLKAIRKDLHDAIGNFDPSFEGCQDFEFALRTALFERILFIPDYLYQYRWHDRSQTVGNCDHQNLMMIKVRQTYLLAVHWILNGPREVLLRFSGKHAAEWAQKNPAPAGQHQWTIDLEASVPFSDHLYKLLLIRMAGNTVTAASHGDMGQLPDISI